MGNACEIRCVGCTEMTYSKFGLQAPQCVGQCISSQGPGGPARAFPHTCVDSEALAAPDPYQSFTPSFAVLSAMASRTASALSLAHSVDLAALSLEFNRNLSC